MESNGLEMAVYEALDLLDLFTGALAEKVDSRGRALVT